MSTEIANAPETVTPSWPMPTGYITFEQYLTLGEDTEMLEWVDGEVIKMAPTTAAHQRLDSFLETIMRLFVEVNDLGEVFRSTFAMKLEQQRRGREPDILFVRKERLGSVTKTYLDGPADLAVEIISPESISRDRSEKYAEYEAAGISEYWLLDPETQQVEFYVLGADKRYHLEVITDCVFRSKALPGFFLRIEWFWQTPARTIKALRELGLF